MENAQLLIDEELALSKLKDIFGHSYFIDDQWDIIKEVFSKKSVLVIKQTGFGKSLCYQLPSLFHEGLTLVFSPLIALMRDQVNYLNGRGIPAACINSDNSRQENARIRDAAQNNEIKLLYIAPERQDSASWKELLSSLNISMIVIDEAHCISVWGHDFRPAYKKIAGTIRKFKDIPIMALTATANHITELDIRDQIGDFTTIRGSLYRDNLELNVIDVMGLQNKMIYIAHLVKKIKGTGIVFTGTKADAEIISSFLSNVNISNTYYHSKIPNRSEVEEAVINNEYKCVVSTNAFGMGIDKPDFRFIIHTQFPGSPLHYYQEIGRAGRDGKLANIFLLYDISDIQLHHYFINAAKPPVERYEDVINYLKRYPASKSFTISSALDLEEIAIKNILNDLEEQRIIERETEHIVEPDKFELISRGDKLSDLEESIVNCLDAPLTVFSISRQVFGNSRKYNKKKVDELLDDLMERELVQRIENTRIVTYYRTSDDHPPLMKETIDKIREYKYKQLNLMVQYTRETSCRMKFLCSTLEDDDIENCGNCDVCSDKFVIKNECENNCEECIDCLNKAYDKHMSGNTVKFVYPSERHLMIGERKNKMIDGLTCYLHEIKEEIGVDEIDSIVNMLGGHKFDIMISLPENNFEFCTQLAEAMNIPHSQMLIEDEGKRENKINWYNRRKHAARFYIENTAIVEDKAILLFDIACQSGITIKEVGKYLSKLNAKMIQPVFISKV